MNKKIDIRNVLILVLLFLVILLITMTALGYIGNVREAEPEFPMAENPLDVAYNFNFMGRDFTIRNTLFGSYYDFYAHYADQIPAIRTVADYYNFIREMHSEDDTLDRLVATFRSLASDNDFTPDQTLEFAMRFVQSIPYDLSKADEVTIYAFEDDDDLRLDLLPRHPYVTLYDRRGICSDKTVLAAAIAERLGYGTAIFSFDAEDIGSDVGHVGLGVRCPTAYSVLNTGYCYVETTSPVRIGATHIYLTPDVQTAGISAMSDITEENILLDFGVATLHELNRGANYYGIMETFRLESRLDELDRAIKEQQDEIESKRVRVNNLNTTLNRMAEEGLAQFFIEDYDAIFTEYEELVEEFNRAVDNLNRDVEIYNRTVRELER